MAGNLTRVEVGFDGGQVAAVRLSEEALAALREALERGEGWHEIESEDGPLSLDAGKVCFLRVEGGGQAIGFAGP